METRLIESSLSARTDYVLNSIHPNEALLHMWCSKGWDVTIIWHRWYITAPHCPSASSNCLSSVLQVYIQPRPPPPVTRLISGSAFLACSASACRVPCWSSRRWRWRGAPRWVRPQRRAPLPWAARSRRAPVARWSLGGRTGRRWLCATVSPRTKTALQVHAPVCLSACLPVYTATFCLTLFRCWSTLKSFFLFPEKTQLLFICGVEILHMRVVTDYFCSSCTPRSNLI